MLVQNEFFDLFVREDEVLLHLKVNGYPLKSFDLITREYPRIKLHSFTILRDALTEVGTEQPIASWLPLIEVTVPANKMVAELVVNETTAEINKKKNEILTEAKKALDKAGILHGHKDLSEEVLEQGRAVIGAVGTDPIAGNDAILTYIELPERKPIIREDGSADYYEMNFVFPVEQDDWLGEKILPEDGIDGMDVFGNTIAATKGSDKVLQYDRKSVNEQTEEDKIVLRALHGGALEFDNGIVCVGKKLIINGDVGPKTGTISFDGAVIIHGTVIAGYAVSATGDISIEGIEGITNAQSVQSTKGDIYIKGGVFGGGETIIEAQGSIFLKHASDCKLYANEVHVGLYLFGTEVIADRVYLDKNRGRIIGGTIKALFIIECAIVGNSHERTTNLHATGVDKVALQQEIQKLALELKNRQEVVKKLEEHTANFSKVSGKLSYEQNEVFKKTKEVIESNELIITESNEEIQKLLSKFKDAVPAKIEVSIEAFPGTIIKIGRSESILHDKTKGVFKLVDGVLNI